MRITTNFTPPVHRLALPLAAAVWTGAAVLAVLLVGMTFGAGGDRAGMAELEERLAQIDARLKQVAVPENLPPAAELSALKQRVAAVNALSSTRGRAPAPLLGALEALIPERAWLAGIHYRAREGEVTLVAESDSAEALTQFLLNLEKSPRFSEVLLARQTPTGAHGGKAVQFEIRLRERS
jgi:Tfp pilus assembly protein PilN